MKILVYQMGKVGSLSISRQLTTHTPVYKSHVHSHGIAESILKDYAETDEEVYIITGIRDLLRKTISAFFQNCDKAGKYYYMGEQEHLKNKSVDEFVSFFESKYVFNLKNTVLPWFTRFNNIVDLDLFDHVFPHQKGHLTLHKGNINLFCYRFEDISNIDMAIRRFLKIPDFELPHINMSSQKWYASHYKEFLEKFKPTEEILDLVYHCTSMQYFYNDIERQAFIEKWS
ncbi:putative capsular polysaccharide synthesis family protein [Temperatibacter marinus]|uniref:Capsular polysaccharide synthesis family protein n=1 Tax=Temperatibacter marinus TaxID=1456591 RepID=A0AA52EJC4_9PROT|nr:putative capsular polysaccharide synthesis family protein [Temperatibacter marinus]WND03344.1 putative capsular polysaccharide synthesis family protein [Temperatibacter marinus]